MGETQVNSINNFSNKTNLEITQNLIKELNISEFKVLSKQTESFK